MQTQNGVPGRPEEAAVLLANTPPDPEAMVVERVHTPADHKPCEAQQLVFCRCPELMRWLRRIALAALYLTHLQGI